MNKLDEYLKKFFMKLHEDLGELENFLARATVPANWNEDGIEEIHHLMEIIEREVSEIDKKSKS